MTKKESNILKGLAIMLMLAHHLFMNANQSGYPELIYGPVLSSPDRLAAFGNLCKLCVTIFAFVTAYGTTMSYKASPMEDNRELMHISLGRLARLLISFQFIYVIAFALCPLGGKSWFTLYSPSRLENIFFALCDFMGISYILQTPSYNSAWWYMSLAVTLVLVLPWLIKLCRRYGAYVLLPGLLLVRWLNVDFVLYRYLLIILLGIVLAQYGTVEKLRAWYMSCGIFKRLISIALCLVVTGLFSVLWLRTDEALLDIYEAALCLPVCLIMVLVVGRIPIIKDVMAFIGKNSMNMFLIHAFIYENWFSAFTYSFKYPIAIYAFLLLSSLLISVLMEQLKKLLHISRLADKLSGALCHAIRV